MKVTLETEGNIYYYMKFIFVLLKYMQGGGGVRKGHVYFYRYRKYT